MLGPSGPKASVVFNIFAAWGAEGQALWGPKAFWCSTYSPHAALKEGTLGPSGPKASMVFKIFSACGAEGGHFEAFRPQSANGVHNFLRLRR